MKTAPFRGAAFETNRDGDPDNLERFDVNSVTESSASGKRKDAPGERDLLMNLLRTESARSRLITNTLDTIGTALRHRSVDCEGAMSWLKDEGLLDLLKLDPREVKS